MKACLGVVKYAYKYKYTHKPIRSVIYSNIPFEIYHAITFYFISKHTSKRKWENVHLMICYYSLFYRVSRRAFDKNFPMRAFPRKYVLCYF